MFPSGLLDVSPGGAADVDGMRAPADLESEVASLCGTINVATAALVDVIAEVIATEAWGGSGYRSPEHWVSIHCGLSPARSKALCRLARRIDELPETVGRFREGRLSEDQVTPIARKVPAQFEASVAELAEMTTPSQIGRIVNSYCYEEKPADGAEDDTSERERQRRRSLSFGWDDDGNLRGSFNLPPDQGAIVKRALEASRSILFNERKGAGDGDRPQEAQVTWADALVRMADIALGVDTVNRPADDRYETLVHWRIEDLDTLDGGAWLHLGPAISPGMLRHLSCDGSVRVMLEKAGVPINEGRKYRTVPRKVRRTVQDRDRGCRYPGCTNTNWVDVHHTIHWQDGGPTDTHNLVCLCPYHHRTHHQGEFAIKGNADEPTGLHFFDRWGGSIPTGTRPAPPPDPPPRGRWRHPTGESFDTGLVWFAETG